MSTNNPFANVKAAEADIEKLAEKVPAAATTVSADVTKAKAEVVAVDSKLTAFIKNNAGKIAVAVLVAVALAVWKLI